MNGLPGFGMPLVLSLVARVLCADPVAVTFDEIQPAASGLDFRHENGASGRFYYVETMGAGVALLDADGDQRVDVYLVNGAPLPGSTAKPAKNALFRNLGGGRFRDVTESSGAGDPSYGTGACSADYDNDGDADLYVLNFGANVLYENDGDGTFTAVTEAAGVGGGGWSVAGAFLDYDRDGRLDLFVVRYLDYSLETDRPCTRGSGPSAVRDYCGPGTYPGLSDRLYRNLGEGRFEDVSASSGIAAKRGKGMGVGVADFDRDGWPDVFVSNDQERNHLWRNRGDGTFEDVALIAGVGLDDGGAPQASMGVAWGDFDRDERLDLFVPCLAGEPFPLYRNEGDGFFRDVGRSAGVAAACLPFTGFGAILADFDDDGWLDAFAANGAVFAREGTRPGVDSFQSCYGQRDVLLRGGADGRFVDVSIQSSPYFSTSRVGRGAAWGDLDGDGRLDLVIQQNGDQVTLLRNTTPMESRHWLAIRAVGRKSNRDGIGARVTVAVGDHRLVREIQAGSSAFSQGDLRPHFGLGDAARVDRVEIIWPSGVRQTIDDVETDRILTVTEPDR